LTSVERTAYPQFPKLMMARELHVFYTPTTDEVEWAGAATESDGALLVGARAEVFFRGWVVSPGMTRFRGWWSIMSAGVWTLVRTCLWPMAVIGPSGITAV
jgi:hypothetical protein